MAQNSSPVKSDARHKLDAIDFKILHDLQENGRMTNVDLAHRAGISAPPCLRRLRALEEEGFIEGYHAEINAQKMGYGVTVFTQVGLKSHNDSDLRAFAEKVETWSNVRESYMMTGDADFMLKVVARDWDDYQNFLTRELTAWPNVNMVRSSLTIGVTKRKPGVPIPANPDI